MAKIYDYTVTVTLENRRDKALNRVFRFASDRLLTKPEQKVLSNKLKRRQEYFGRGFASDYDVYIDITKAKYPNDKWLSELDYILGAW